MSEVEHDLVPVAEAMPEEKFTFVPATGEYKGVRNFGEQVKHVAASNFFYFAGFAPEKPLDAITLIVPNSTSYEHPARRTQIANSREAGFSVTGF